MNMDDPGATVVWFGKYKDELLKKTPYSYRLWVVWSGEVDNAALHRRFSRLHRAYSLKTMKDSGDPGKERPRWLQGRPFKHLYYRLNYMRWCDKNYFGSLRWEWLDQTQRYSDWLAAHSQPSRPRESHGMDSHASPQGSPFEDILDLPEDHEYTLLENLIDRPGAFREENDPKLEAALSSYFRAYKKRHDRKKYPIRRGLRRYYASKDQENEDEDDTVFDDDKDFINDSGLEDEPADNSDYQPPSNHSSESSEAESGSSLADVHVTEEGRVTAASDQEAAVLEAADEDEDSEETENITRAAGPSVNRRARISSSSSSSSSSTSDDDGPSPPKRQRTYYDSPSQREMPLDVSDDEEAEILKRRL